MDSPIWLEFEFIQDFMAVLVTCKIDEDWIKSKVAIIQTFSPLQVYGKNFRRSWVSNSTVNSPIWPEIEIIRFYGWRRYLQVWWSSNQKWSSYRSDIFPIISQIGITGIARTTSCGPGHAKTSYAICEQQRRRSDCSCVQSDQHLCCSLLR